MRQRQWQRGAALMLVLWLVALMSALVGGFAFSARIESMLGRGLAHNVAAAEAARAGVEYAIYRLWHADPAQRWRADGRESVWEFGVAEVTLRAVDVAGKVDLNASDAPLLAALMLEAGASAQSAGALAARIVEWREVDDFTRNQGARFESVAQLQQVAGMDAALYARLWPDLTIHSGRRLPDPRFAPPAVLAALGMDVRAALSLRERASRFDLAALPAGSGAPVAIEASARLGDGRESRLYALVRAGSVGRRYTVLEWKQGAELQ